MVVNSYILLYEHHRVLTTASDCIEEQLDVILAEAIHTNISLNASSQQTANKPLHCNNATEKPFDTNTPKIIKSGALIVVKKAIIK